MNMQSILIILFAIGILVSISAVNAGWFDGFNDEEDISVIDVSTYADCNINEKGDKTTDYVVEGGFKGSPIDNPDEYYTLKIILYDEYGKSVGHTDELYTSEDIEYSSKNPGSFILGYVTIDGFKNVSLIGIKLYNPGGEILFEDNTTFSIENINEYYYNESDTSMDTNYNDSEEVSESNYDDYDEFDNSFEYNYEDYKDDTPSDYEPMNEFKNYKEMKDWLSDDWRGDKYLTKSYKESKQYKENQNRFSVDGVYERDLIADSVHKIYHKPTCELISKIPYNHKSKISRLSNTIKSGYTPCQECIGGSPGYRPLPSIS